jgi:putative ABC transport system permease protein
MNSVYLVFKNLVRNPLRLCLTVFATFIAFMVYGLLSSFQAALDSGVELAADDRLIVVNKINFTQPLPISYVNKVRGIDHVVALTHLNWFGGYYQDPQNEIVMFAVDPEGFLGVYDEVLMTEGERSNWVSNRRGLIAGKSIATTNGWQVGDRIPVNSSIFMQRDRSRDWDFDVAAIYTGADAQTDTDSVYFHYEYFDETQAFGRGFVGRLVVRTEHPRFNEQVVHDIDDMFANTPYETETVPEQTFNKAFAEQIGNLGLILTSVVLAAFFIILVIVGNSMVLAIRERTNEIGVMKTLGFTSARVFSMVLAESLALAFAGGLLGLLSADVLIAAVNRSSYQLPTLILNAATVIKALLIMLTLGLVTGIVPAVKALRLNIVSALSRA